MSKMMQVPEGWEVKRVKDISKTFAGGTPDRETSSYYGGTIPWVKSGEVNQETISTTEEYITEEGLKNSNTKLISKGTILIAMYGATAGQIAILNIDACSNQAVLAVPVLTNNMHFIYYMLNYKMPKLLFQAQGSGQPNLSKQLVDNMFFLLPEKHEQNRIAEILSMCDRAIEASEKLITKEKQIKKGLMNDLLTHGIDEKGRIRTPQTHRHKESELGMIPEGWEVKALSQFFKLKSGDTKPSDTSKQGKFTVFGGNGMTGFSDFTNNDEETLIIGRVGEYCGSVHIAFKCWITDNALFIDKKIVPFDINYMFYLLTFLNLNQYKSETGQPLINQSVIGSIHISFPMNPREQQQVANILTIQDKKIETEEANLAKLKELKKGLMNDLLSGRVRV